jgi:RNA polymerase sigma-70 factor (ECF subfamily)
LAAFDRHRPIPKAAGCRLISRTANPEKLLEAFAKFEQWRVGARAEAAKEMADSPGHDHELLRQLAKGSEAAFRDLYGRYQGPIFRFALHMSGNQATAEEVTQEVFMMLMINPKAYRLEKGSLGGYLFGIARNLTRRSIQNRHLDVPLGVYDESSESSTNGLAACGQDILENLSRAESLELLRKAVLSLPEPYREAVVLCELEEMSYCGAAELLGCSAGTVASRLHRGRSILKAKLSCQKCAK